MAIKKQPVQAELFGVSEIEEVKQQIRELDQMISRALKQKKYQQAKDLTGQQEALLQKLVDPKDGNG